MEACGTNQGPKLELCSANGGWRSLCPLCFSWRGSLWGLCVVRSGTSCQSPLASPTLFPNSHNSSQTVVLPQLRGAHVQSCFGGEHCHQNICGGNTPSKVWSRVNDGFLWEMGCKLLTQSHKPVWVSATEMRAETEHATPHQYVSVGKIHPYSSTPTPLPHIWGLHS